MGAAAPQDDGRDPFAALQQHFAAMDEMQEAQYSETREVLKNGREAVSRIKKSAEAVANGDTNTRLCVKSFTESDVARCEEIEAAEATAQRHEPVTEVLDQSELRARLEAAAQAAETRNAAAE